MIHLFYLSNNTTGGWVTFTYHLCKSFEVRKHPYKLWKIGNRSEGSVRPFGYGLNYQNVCLDDALELCANDPVIIVAAAKPQAAAAALMAAAGARFVLHDPTELRAGLAEVEIRAPWVIRRAVAAQVPGSVFIRHPYVRHPPGAFKQSGAVSTSRIDFDKHTEIILAANRLGAKIKIYGFENRLYTKFKIQPEFPEWEQSVCAYPREATAAYDILKRAKFMVDMSEIKGDGGGTQYTFLEAWDAGAVPIINYKWLRDKDDMIHAYNCYAVSDARELKNYARMTGDVSNMVSAGYASLARHAPKVIVPKVMKWLES